MTDDKITAALAPVRERMAACDDGFFTDQVACIRSAGDVPRLLAAVEVALRLADRWDADAAELDRDVAQGRKSPYAGDHALSDTDEALARELRQCAADLRSDLLAALAGKDKTDD